LSANESQEFIDRGWFYIEAEDNADKVKVKLEEEALPSERGDAEDGDAG
jgi:hypothetical protein